jgi:hypothetical protein
MVAPEPGEPLLLYIEATTEVTSMVLVAERPKPKQPPKGAPAARSRSLDPDPTKGPCDQEAFGSQLPDPTLCPKPQIGSRLLEVPSGLEDQEVSRSQSPLQVLIASTSLGPSSQRCP